MGLGNILCGDEGLGVRLAERLFTAYDFPPEVYIVDGGTQGMPLLTFVEQADRLIILDAVDFGLKPGTKVVHDGEMPAYLTAKKLYAHQSSFAEVLGMAQFRGKYPKSVDLIGMQPVDLSYGADLSPEARAALPELETACLGVLQKYGIHATQAVGQKNLNAPCLHHAGVLETESDRQ